MDLPAKVGGPLLFKKTFSEAPDWSHVPLKSQVSLPDATSPQASLSPAGWVPAWGCVPTELTDPPRGSEMLAEPHALPCPPGLEIHLAGRNVWSVDRRPALLRAVHPPGSEETTRMRVATHRQTECVCGSWRVRSRSPWPADLSQLIRGSSTRLLEPSRTPPFRIYVGSCLRMRPSRRSSRVALTLSL